MTFVVCNAQVVNIESQRIHTDSVRRGGEFNFNYSYSNVNSKSLSIFDGSLSLQQKSKDLKTIWLILGNLELSKAKNEDFENASFLHLRYNRKINPWLRWEVFTQVQSNLPIGVRVRYLAGTGPRFKLITSTNFNLYFGSLYMYEREKITDSVILKKTFNRNSSYLSFSINLPPVKGEIISTTYYQPSLANFSNYRIYTENRLSFSITKRFRTQTTFRYFFDSRPPKGINNYTTAFDQGFALRF
jgi:hypothetical protein